MSLKIRLRQQGRTNRQTYRLIVTDIRNPRDGKYLEALGHYDPLKAVDNFSLNSERLNYWLSQGAEISERVESLIANKAPEIVLALREKKQKKMAKEASLRRNRKKSSA